MKIVFAVSAFNGLSQRAYVELTQAGHLIEVHQINDEQVFIEAVESFQPDLIIAPFLKKAIPTEVWKNYVCLIVHPGIRGDRGAYSLDWAIMNNEKEWGVTLLQANETMDGGDIWAYKTFKMRDLATITKGNIYRHEVTQAAMECILEAVKKFESTYFRPEPLNYLNAEIKGTLHPVIKQKNRSFSWNDAANCIVRKIKAADSTPGVLATIGGNEYYVYGAHTEEIVKGNTPGEIIAQRNGAICIAADNGAVWLTHLKIKNASYKVKATLALDPSVVKKIPHSDFSPFDRLNEDKKTFREIWYEEENRVGYLHFNFYNGAMSTEQCRRLTEVYKEALKKDIRVLVLMGGQDIWSNGIDLNTIEHAESPADESWENINAINDFVKEVINTTSKIVISAMQGNAGAGGVIMALAADKVFARKGVVLNPHYKKMGGLYGSEYWTYLLPKRVGMAKAHALTENCEPISTYEAKSIGLIDDYWGDYTGDFCKTVKVEAEKIAFGINYVQTLRDKQRQRENDENYKPLAAYRSEELEKMEENFYGENMAYHFARYHFVHKVSCMEQIPEQILKKYASQKVEVY
ncbi:enoyl-CoA hydratase-related protein [Solitalea lacus]|uniref:enoyl-CoA hydratase-related protein n=1 Tax=Solitalea lacus TaxID=2911172 RepID=UPI001EDACDAB|nr:enoyl-CoA hydratase-related protein [Solitalea lacus]UKJ07181.1 enoyl-CoA hydratase-related protein [Solitalea lacus]